MTRVALLDVNVLVALFDPDHIHHDPAHDSLSAIRYAQITDAYLLGLAFRKGGQLATFDRHIPSRAVIGADEDHLQLIPA